MSNNTKLILIKLYFTMHVVSACSFAALCIKYLPNITEFIVAIPGVLYILYIGLVHAKYYHDEHIKQ